MRSTDQILWQKSNQERDQCSGGISCRDQANDAWTVCDALAALLVLLELNVDDQMSS